MIELATPVTTLTRVGATTAGRLKKLGIETVSDLIFYYPFRWEDFSAITPIASLALNQQVTISATVQLIQTKRSPVKRKNITEALVKDDSGSFKIIWFNQPYIADTLKPGDSVYFSGKVTSDKYTLQFVNPVYEKAKEETTHTARIVPVYPSTSNVTQKQIRFLIKQALDAVDQIEEFLPEDVILSEKIIGIKDALRQIHFPDDNKALQLAIARLKFEELFLFELQVFLSRADLQKNKSVEVAFHEGEVRQFVESLPFVMTGDQKKAAWKIISDMQSDQSMNRLLEGDVGSGKTVVAALSMYNAALGDNQSVLMAPTEILAQQHYNTVYNLLKNFNISVALFTRTQRLLDGEEISKKDMINALSSGEALVVIGTHAVIQDGVKFKNLALTVVDEQHRFGVEQRKKLKAQSGTEHVPHLLSMTATPIPRSLSLALYGDLDISIIAEKPKDRKPITTSIIDAKHRSNAYDFIKKEIDSGRQIFVVCPLIDPSDKLGVRSVTEEFERLQKEVFSDYRISMVHGKLKAAEKEQVMSDFLAKKNDILVSTSVIEVGVDVPNATVMVIEGAERFGLAQLHQFRGRVGRSEYQSYCFLFSDNLSPKVRNRLQALVDSQDGFSLAELDLKLRGPGDMYGFQQSGWPQFKLAQISDHQLIERAKKAAEELLVASPGLEKYPLLKKRVDHILHDLHLE